MKYKGNPILGDNTYGRSKKKYKKINKNIEKEIDDFNRQALHAKNLTFIHPTTKKEVFFEAERPKDFNLLIKNLKKISVTKIMTPRVVVVSAEENINLEEFKTKKRFLNFSRIPLFSKQNEKITGYVFLQDILVKS